MTGITLVALALAKKQTLAPQGRQNPKDSPKHRQKNLNITVDAVRTRADYSTGVLAIKSGLKPAPWTTRPPRFCNSKVFCQEFI